MKTRMMVWAAVLLLAVSFSGHAAPAKPTIQPVSDSAASLARDPFQSAFTGGAVIGGVIAGSATRERERRERYYDHRERHDYYDDGRYPRYYPY
jgi:hypothetical protein